MTLTSVDNQGSAERYLLKTVQNFLKDQAKATPHGKLRARLDNLLGKDPGSSRLAAPSAAGDLPTAPKDRGRATSPSCTERPCTSAESSSRRGTPPAHTPQAAREALTTVTVAVLTDAAGIVRAEDLAHVLLERFRHQIAPETTRGLCVHDTDEQPAHANREPVQPLASICADELWLVSPASSG